MFTTVKGTALTPYDAKHPGITGHKKAANVAETPLTNGVVKLQAKVTPVTTGSQERSNGFLAIEHFGEG